MLLVEIVTLYDLEIFPGESVAIRGPSGSGKTTLLTILGCLDHPNEGRLIIDGTDVTALPESALSKVRSEKTGFVFQSFNLMPFLNARENVELPMELSSMSRQERKERARELLKAVGLADREDHRPSRLSAGSSKGSPSPGPWPTVRPYCWRISPPGTWTPSTSSRSCD